MKKYVISLMIAGVLPMKPPPLEAQVTSPIVANTAIAGQSSAAPPISAQALKEAFITGKALLKTGDFVNGEAALYSVVSKGNGIAFGYRDSGAILMAMAFMFRQDGDGATATRLAKDALAQLTLAQANASNKPYAVTIIDVGALPGTTFSIIAPPGFTTVINGMAERTAQTAGAGSFTVVIQSNRQIPVARSGVASSFSKDRAYWQVSLGALQDGSSAGWLSISDLGYGSDLSSLFTPAALQFPQSPAEITGAYLDPISGNVSQVCSHDACVNVVTLSSTSYELDFYSTANVTGSSPPYTFSGDKYASYIIAEGTNASQITITSNTYHGSTTAIRTAITTLTRSGSAWPYHWSVQDWATSGTATPVSVEVSNGGSTSTSVPETVCVENEVPSTPLVATNTSKYYTEFDWGPELTSEIHGSNSSTQDQTTYQYYTDSSSTNDYGFFQSSSHNGHWIAYEYLPNTNYDGNDGVVSVVHQQYFNSGSTIPSPLSSTDSGGEAITSYTYTQDFWGVDSKPTEIKTTYGGTIISLAEITYAGINTWYPLNGLPTVFTTRTDTASSNSATLSSASRYYREDITDALYCGKPCSITRADGTMDDYAYQRNSSTSGWSGLGTGGYSRVSVIHGVATAQSGTSSYSAIDGYNLVNTISDPSVQPVYLLPNESTMDQTIRDLNAHVIETATCVWSGSAWAKIKCVDYTYDTTTNQMLTKTAGNGSSETYVYNGDQLTSKTDEAGVATIYGYDNAGRVDSTEISASSAGSSFAASSLTTTLTLDAAGNVIQKVIGSGTPAITSGTTYDDAGRIASTADPNFGTTSYSYSPTTLTTDVTLPNGGTREDITLADGHLYSETGSGVVPRYFTYTTDASGKLTTTIKYGTSDSVRSESVVTDLLGRTVSTTRPTFGSTSVTYTVQNCYDATTGLLTKTTRSDSSGAHLADILYGYDPMAECYRKVLDIDGTGSLAASSPDNRVTDTLQNFEQDSDGKWWKTTTTLTYPTASSGTALTASVVQDRMTGFSTLGTLVLSDRKVTDVHGTVTETTSTAAPSADTVTTVSKITGFSSSTPPTVVTVAGLTISQNGFDGLVTTTAYDSLWRPVTQKDSRSNTTTTTYKTGTTLVAGIADGTGTPVAAYTYDGAGRVTATADANSNHTYVFYDALNHVLDQWGDVPQPVQYGYDVYGQRTSMGTFQMAAGFNTSTFEWGTSPSGTTTWAYDPETGLLTSKTDAAGKSVGYTYNTFGQTSVRTWARASTTTSTYAYSSSTGELISITYNDGTAEVTYTYNRTGELAAVGDATGSRTFHYDNSSNPLELTAEHLDSTFYGSRWLSQIYNTATGSTEATYGPYTYTSEITGRSGGFQLGAGENGADDLSQNYLYTDQNQLAGIETQNGSSATPRNFYYSYPITSDLVSGTSDNVSSFSTTRNYETQRNLLTSISGSWGSSTPITEFDYIHNSLYQTSSVVQSGSAYTDYDGATGATFRLLSYDAHGQLTSDVGYLGSTITSTGSPLPDRNFEYAYDAVGDRTSSNYSASSSFQESYSANDLNQYSSRQNLSVPVSGTLNNASGYTNANVVLNNGSGLLLAQRQGGFWAAEAMPPSDSSNNPKNNTTSATFNLTLDAGCQGQTSAGHYLVNSSVLPLTIPPKSQSYTYDYDGNLTCDNMWNYTYDAENRVIAMETTSDAQTAGVTHVLLTFAYDYLGRRVEKKFYNPSTTLVNDDRYVYDGWNLIADYQYTSGLQLYRTFTWGLDVTGSLAAAGGVGALLELTNISHSGGTTTTKDYFPTYDGNGNIASLVNSVSGVLAAAYEYSPFGEPLRAQAIDSTVADNPFRFSTKFTDAESGLIYYGNRFYSPSLGRFINRDPIEEAGGINLYGFVNNNPANSFDVLGDAPPAFDSFPIWENSNASDIGAAGRAVQASYAATASAAAYALAAIYSQGLLVTPYVSSNVDLWSETVSTSDASAIPTVDANGNWIYVLPSYEIHDTKTTTTSGYYADTSVLVGGSSESYTMFVGSTPNAPNNAASAPPPYLAASGPSYAQGLASRLGEANDLAGNGVGVAGLLAGNATLGSNLKLYSGWGGNQYVSTVGLEDVLKILGNFSVAAGAVIDGYKVLNGQESLGQGAANTAVGVGTIVLPPPFDVALGLGYLAEQHPAETRQIIGNFGRTMAPGLFIMPFGF